MNVYRFINSKDIREHLEAIKYPFGSLEAAWIIYQCRFASLEEKHAAWRELIRTMPDCAIEERPNIEAHDSLHRFLAAYMERETKLLHAFCENDGGIYRWMECQEDGVRFEHPGIYTDYAKCCDRISREIGDNEDGEIASYLVTKTYPDAEEPCMQSELSAEGELLSVRESQAGPDPFEGLFFVFPTPFQKGDIVWEPNTQGYCKGPFVLTGVSGEAEAPGHRRGGDNSDMTAWGYFQDESGNIYHETMWNYMDLEYYRGPLTGKQRVLRALGNCLKGEIDEGLFARAYHAILTEEYAGSLVPRDITKEGMTLAALCEPEPVRLWLDDLRKAPTGYKWCTSVNAAIRCIELCEKAGCPIELIDCDHDLGDYAKDGGDGIRLIDWLAERGTFYRIELHTMNPVGRENMQREIDRYWPVRREKEG